LETIGARLRQIRESKNLTIKQIAEDTNISSSYIEALENEDFDRFPGETYIIGFIRSYAEYLRIEPEEIIKAYRGYKIGESDTPLEELTRPTKSAFSIKMGSAIGIIRTGVIAVAFIALLAAGFFLVRTYLGSMINAEKDDAIDRIKTDYAESEKKDDFERIRNLKLTKNKGFVLAYKKEAVQFLVDTKECIFTLEDIAGNTALVKLFPEKTDLTLEMDRSIRAMFPGVEREVYITLRGLTENRAKIMVTLGGEVEAAAAEEGSEGETVTETKDSSMVEATDKGNLKIVFEAMFQSKTYLELYLDGQQKARGIIQAGTSERWEANEYIQLKVGNAGGMKAKINGKDYVFGLNGQVANKIITWTKDPVDPNVYHIVVKDW